MSCFLPFNSLSDNWESSFLKLTFDFVDFIVLEVLCEVWRPHEQVSSVSASIILLSKHIFIADKLTLKLNENIFRSYDIRGIYGKDIDEHLAEQIGMAFGELIGPGKKVLVGRDVRVSSPSLSKSLIKGVMSRGLDIVYAGVIPTPLLYFAISHYKLDGGITVSASHNPPEWNGFKVCRKDAYVVGLGTGLEIMRERIKKDAFAYVKEGRMEDMSSQITKEYLDSLSGKIEPLSGLKVGIDPGNGAYSGLATEIFKRKGAEVHAINDVPDGRFPSRSPEPNPTTIKELVNLVKSKGLDIGIAFDGDGDRVLFVTEAGEIIGGDVALALLVKEYLKSGEKVAYEPSCSSAVEDEIKEMHGVPLLTKVGHSNFKENMKRQKARFGGEISGHMYFEETYGADDGLFGALKMAELLQRRKKKLSELVGQLPKYVKFYAEYDADDQKKFGAVDRIKADFSGMGYKIIDIDGVKAVTGDGWLLVRASNTGPKIKISVEARTKKRLEELKALVAKEMAAAI